VESSIQAAPLTQLIAAWRAGDGGAFDELIEASFGELRAMAQARLREQPGVPTWTPQDLLNETVVRLLGSTPDLRNRLHFFGTVSLMMRAILVDHARARSAQKRGGGLVAVTLTESIEETTDAIVDVLAIDEALTTLAARDARCADVLHLACFAGFKPAEIAELLQVSPRTVERDLRFARAWVQMVAGDG